MIWRQHRARQKEADGRQVRVMNLTPPDQWYGPYRLPAGEWASVPWDLAARLAIDPRFRVDDPILQPAPPVATEEAGLEGATGTASPMTGWTPMGYELPAGIGVPRGITAGPWPTVAVVVPIHECPDLLRTCLDTLWRTEYRGDRWTVWVDDGSRDPGVAQLLVDQKHVVRTKRPGGFAKAANAGARLTQADYYVFLNQDCLVSNPCWLEALVEWMEFRPSCAVAGSKLIYPDGTVQHAGIDLPAGSAGVHRGRGQEFMSEETSRYRRVPGVTGAAFATRRSVFDELGGFDEVYKFGQEDVDFCLRATVGLGLEVWYVPGSVVTHLDNGTCESSTEVRDRVAKWRTDGEWEFRRRWGPFIDRSGVGEIAFALARIDLGSRLWQEVYRLAGYSASCGRPVAVYACAGGPKPDGAPFKTGNLLELTNAETLIATGWETLALCRRIPAARRIYLHAGKVDPALIRRYLGAETGWPGGYKTLPLGGPVSQYAKTVLEAPV
jgi:GT2 family glycosyltransferase